MARRRKLPTPPEPNVSLSDPKPPTPRQAIATAALAIFAITITAWLATMPRAEVAQTDLATWFNHPPQPIAALFAVVNPLFRPIPLIILGLLWIIWVLLTATQTSQRWELVRAAIVTLLIAEVAALIAKHAASQPRPLAVLPGMDDHGYPIQPHGNAYPSAHTAAVVGLVAGLWPWMRWPQRIVGLAAAVLVATNRLYIGAHWPIDVVGGAAIGLFAASVTWLIAAEWPIRRQRSPKEPNPQLN